jgi:transcriptional regulator with XRE-family HTH domain
MPRGRVAKRPATALQVARNGHMAATLRQALAQRGWTPGDLNEALQKPKGHVTVYAWLSAKGAPGPETRAKLAKLLNVSGTDLRPRDEPEDAMPVVTSPTTAVPPARRVGEALSFTINEAGAARIRLDVTLPLAQAMPLVRLLLDAEAVTRIGETLE